MPCWERVGASPCCKASASLGSAILPHIHRTMLSPPPLQRGTDRALLPLCLHKETMWRRRGRGRNKGVWCRSGPPTDTVLLVCLHLSQPFHQQSGVSIVQFVFQLSTQPNPPHHPPERSLGVISPQLCWPYQRQIGWTCTTLHRRLGVSCRGRG